MIEWMSYDLLNDNLIFFITLFNFAQYFFLFALFYEKNEHIGFFHYYHLVLHYFIIIVILFLSPSSIYLQYGTTNI